MSFWLSLYPDSKGFLARFIRGWTFCTDKGKMNALKADDIMEPGLGYWIHVNKNCVWPITN